MSKIAEQKALETYPMVVSEQTISCRLSYSEGYDQAKQDFLEKAEDAISMISRHYVGEDYSFDQIWEQFKNYIKNE